MTTPSTPAPLGELSPEEIRLIQAHRDEQARQVQIKARRLELLKAAYEFERWMQENGIGNSFSAFTDEFNYEGADRSSVHWAATRLIAFADEAARHGRAAQMPASE